MNETILHNETWNRLRKLRDRLPHALLVHGPAGIGKRDLAQDFAHALLCDATDGEGRACGQCPSCRWLAEGNHPDFRCIEPDALAGEDGEEAKEKDAEKKRSTQITIDQVRGLDDFLHVGAHRQGWRIVLVHPAEAMNTHTANALLKSLEEPGERTLFLLVTGTPGRLLPTIRSRCQDIAVPMPEAGSARAWLLEQGGANVEDMEALLAFCGGAPYAALRLAQDEWSASRRELLEILAAPGASPLEAAARMEKHLKTGDLPAEMRLETWVEWMQRWAADLALAGATGEVRYHPRQAAALRKLAAHCTAHAATRFYRNLCRQRLLARRNLNPRLFLESLFLDYHVLMSNGEGERVGT